MFPMEEPWTPSVRGADSRLSTQAPAEAPTLREAQVLGTLYRGSLRPIGQGGKDTTPLLSVNSAPRVGWEHPPQIPERFHPDTMNVCDFNQLFLSKWFQDGHRS